MSTKMQNLKSPFSCEKDDEIICLQRSFKEIKEIKKLVRDKINNAEYAATDYMLLNTLYKFGLLNSFNLTLYINQLSPLPDDMKKSNYRENLKRMIKDGAIETYSIDKKQESATYKQDYVYYALSKGAYQFINENARNKNQDNEEIKTVQRTHYEVMENTAAENMRLLVKNQIEINLLQHRKKHRIHIDHWGIDNLSIEQNDNEYICAVLPVDKAYYGKDFLWLYILPVLKNDEGKYKYLEEIIMLNRLMKNRKEELSIAVTVVDSIHEMCEVYGIQKKFDDFEIEHLFLLEQNCATGDCLKKLYLCRTTQDAQVQYSIAPIRYRKITKKEVEKTADKERSKEND